MKVIYRKILEKAIPYYKKGRKEDIEHVKWLIKKIPKFIKKEKIDKDILMCVAILHDVGYSKVPKNSDPLKLNIRKLHSEESAKISKKILEELNYSKKKIKEIERLILKHDNWAFGDNFSDEPILKIFNNFDSMWVASKKGFSFYQRIRKMSPKETYEQIKRDQEKNIKERRKWFNKKIEKYYKKLMRKREKELK